MPFGRKLVEKRIAVLSSFPACPFHLRSKPEPAEPSIVAAVAITADNASRTHLYHIHSQGDRCLGIQQSVYPPACAHPNTYRKVVGTTPARGYALLGLALYTVKEMKKFGLAALVIIVLLIVGFIFATSSRTAVDIDPAVRMLGTQTPVKVKLDNSHGVRRVTAYVEQTAGDTRFTSTREPSSRLFSGATSSPARHRVHGGQEAGPRASRTARRV